MAFLRVEPNQKQIPLAAVTTVARPKNRFDSTRFPQAIVDRACSGAGKIELNRKVPLGYNEPLVRRSAPSRSTQARRDAPER